MIQWSLVKWQHAWEGPVKYHNFDMVEGMHYYLEDGNKVVFTALFHKQRGSCCGGKCRHCPFDPKHEKGSKKLKKDEKEKS